MKNNEDLKGTELAVREVALPAPVGVYDVNRSLELHRIACKLFQSGLFPNAKSEAGAFAIVEYGDELGVPPMIALQNINNIQGKLSTGAQLMLALAMRRGVEYQIVEESEETCHIHFTRGAAVVESIFTIKDAQRAGLVRQNSPWATAPATMLFHRAASRGVRKIAPDAVTGLLLDDEAREIAPEPSSVNEAANGLKEALKKHADEEIAKAESQFKAETERSLAGKSPDPGSEKPVLPPTPRVPAPNASPVPPKVKAPEAPKVEKPGNGTPETPPTIAPETLEALKGVYAISRKAGIPKNEVLAAMQEIVPMAASLDDLEKWGADELNRLQGSLTFVAEGKKKVKAPTVPFPDELA